MEAPIPQPATLEEAFAVLYQVTLQAPLKKADHAAVERIYQVSVMQLKAVEEKLNELDELKKEGEKDADVEDGRPEPDPAAP